MAETWGVDDWNAVAREYTADKGWQEAGARAVAKSRARMERDLEAANDRARKFELERYEASALALNSGAEADHWRSEADKWHSSAEKFERQAEDARRVAEKRTRERDDAGKRADDQAGRADDAEARVAGLERALSAVRPVKPPPPDAVAWANFTGRDSDYTRQATEARKYIVAMAEAAAERQYAAALTPEQAEQNVAYVRSAEEQLHRERVSHAETQRELEELRAKCTPPPGTWKLADDWLEDSRLTADAREIVEFLKSLAEPPKTKRELAKEALQSMPGVTWFGDTVDQVVDAVMAALGVEDGDG